MVASKMPRMKRMWNVGVMFPDDVVTSAMSLETLCQHVQMGITSETLSGGRTCCNECGEQHRSKEADQSRDGLTRGGITPTSAVGPLLLAMSSFGFLVGE